MKLAEWKQEISHAVGAAGWEAVLGVLRAGGGGAASTAEVARGMGLSTARAARVLGDLPAVVIGMRREGRSTVWWVRATEGLAWTRDELDEAAEAARFEVGTRRSEGSVAEVSMEAIEVAHGLLRSSDPMRCAREIRERGLDAGGLLPRVAPGRRTRVGAALALLHADYAMQRGEVARAVAVCRRAEAAVREVMPVYLVNLYATWGAALRMSQGHADEALERYSAALDAVCALPEDEVGTARRWMLGARAAPLVVTGRWTEALETVKRARGERCVEAASAEAEMCLTEVRVLLGNGDVKAADVALAEGRYWAQRGQPWVRGWLHRYEADFLRAQCGEGSEWRLEEAWALSLGRAWKANAGFGFQRRMVMARMVTGPVGVDVEAIFDPWTRRSVALEVGAEHRRRWGKRLEDCPVCRRGTLRERVRHVLGFGGEGLPALYR